MTRNAGAVYDQERAASSNQVRAASSNQVRVARCVSSQVRQ